MGPRCYSPRNINQIKWKTITFYKWAVCDYNIIIECTKDTSTPRRTWLDRVGTYAYAIRLCVLDKRSFVKHILIIIRVWCFMWKIIIIKCTLLLDDKKCLRFITHRIYKYIFSLHILIFENILVCMSLICNMC